MKPRLTVLLSVETASAADKQRLQQWLEENLPASLSVDTVIRQGEAADQIITAAKELGSKEDQSGSASADILSVALPTFPG